MRPVWLHLPTVRKVDSPIVSKRRTQPTPQWEAIFTSPLDARRDDVLYITLFPLTTTMDAESSDILGGRLPVTSIHQGRIWAPISFSQLLSLIVVAALGVWIVVQHVIPWNRKRQEILYRK